MTPLAAVDLPDACPSLRPAVVLLSGGLDSATVLAVAKAEGFTPPGRMRFLTRGQTEVGPDERPPFGCCLLIWEAREPASSPRLVPEVVVQVRVPRPDGQDSLFDLDESA